MSVTVRAGELKDLDWILGQLREFSDFADTKHSLFGDLVGARHGMIRMMKDHVVLVAEENAELTKPVGFIAGVITPHLMNPKIKVLAQLFWWVPPSLRGGVAASALLNEFLRIGKEDVKTDWITFGLMTKTPVTEKALTRRGFRLFERSYLLEV